MPANVSLGTAETLSLLGLQEIIVPAKNSMTETIENIETLFHIPTSKFNDWAQLIFQFQQKNNPLFAQWHLIYPPTSGEFTFLPIAFFKSHLVSSASKNAEITFSSSGTTGSTTSLHHVAELRIYEESFTKGFELFYGPIENYCVIGLLPSYLERTGSSLVYMVDHFIKKGKPNSGFYLKEYETVADIIQDNENRNQPTLLLGVTFAMLEMIQSIPQQQWKQTIVMETGGMKGRGPEITREELQTQLTTHLGVQHVHSEYGMTELLSQAYSQKNGRFHCPPWMKICIQDPGDPQQWFGHAKTGRICIIDLANVYSCSFIATDDLGKTHEDGSFEVLGRIDFSDLRGCNQLVID